MNIVKTRFAPSPTGYLHIGGARTALFAWLYARSNQGECVLRIEDTDKERSKEEYTKEIIKSFKWLGINFDDEVIYQSNNFDRYNEVINTLLKNGSAYVCNCSKERLSELRTAQESRGQNPKYDGKCRELNLERSDETVVRFKFPQEGTTKFTDIVKGNIEVKNNELDDFIIERADGAATYNLCVVVDDIDSNITHVIRGDDHVNNTFKQVNIFNALNKEVPVYGHVPMILGEDGKRLSKRHGALGVGEYAEMGILPDALKNYLLRLGWSKGDMEIFNQQEMEEVFKEGDFNQSPATFSMDKLLWFNKHYLDQLSAEQLIEGIELPEFDKSEYSKVVIETIRERCSSLNDFSLNSFYFFNDPAKYDDQLIGKHCNENTSDHMTLLESSMASLEDWDQVSVKEVIDETVASLSVGFGKIGLPLRLALTGTVNSPSIDLVCSILGKEVTLRRLNSFLNRIKN
jgi:glutamyl-tRNA synthetase